MSIRYVSRDLEWTDSMKECVQQKIVGPLEKHIKHVDYELSVHLECDRKRSNNRRPRFAMWVVLQTFDGHNNEVVRREGDDFHYLTNEVSSSMRSKLKKTADRRRLLPHMFRFAY